MDYFQGTVYMYYGLTNYYQNHRRYVRSRDDSQLHGNDVSSLYGDCEPFKIKNDTMVAPCGAIANSLFNGLYIKCILQALMVCILNVYGTVDANITWWGEHMHLHKILKIVILYILWADLNQLLKVFDQNKVVLNILWTNYIFFTYCTKWPVGWNESSKLIEILSSLFMQDWYAGRYLIDPVMCWSMNFALIDFGG